jgi:hypothetical protein
LIAGAQRGQNLQSANHEEGTMHDQPAPTEHEQEEAQTSRQQEEESMRYPEHHDPDEQTRRAHNEGDD